MRFFFAVTLYRSRRSLRRFRKIAIAPGRFVMSVLQSVRMEQLGLHWKDFHEIWYLSIFRKSIEKIQVSLK